jgi:hypothetical protein
MVPKIHQTWSAVNLLSLYHYIQCLITFNAGILHFFYKSFWYIFLEVLCVLSQNWWLTIRQWGSLLHRHRPVRHNEYAGRPGVTWHCNRCTLLKAIITHYNKTTTTTTIIIHSYNFTCVCTSKIYVLQWICSKNAWLCPNVHQSWYI